MVVLRSPHLSVYSFTCRGGQGYRIGVETRAYSRKYFGRLHRSRLIPRDDVIPDERGVTVRKAAQFGTGVGPGPGYGSWESQALVPIGPTPAVGRDVAGGQI